MLEETDGIINIIQEYIIHYFTYQPVPSLSGSFKGKGEAGITVREEGIYILVGSILDA